MKLEVMTKENLSKVLSKLHIKAGDIVFISSKDLEKLHISKLQYLLAILMEFLGDQGTMVMDLSGTNFEITNLDGENQLKNNQVLRDLMPGFNKGRAHIYSNDILAKNLSLNNNAVISDNHTYPYIGVGKYAKLICKSQSLDFPNGNMSPLARLYELRAKAILINSEPSSFKLNHYLFETNNNSVIHINGGAIQKNNKTIWEKFLEKQIDHDKLKTIIDSNSFKQLFYHQKVNKQNLLSTDIRNYIDYCRMYL